MAKRGPKPASPVCDSLNELLGYKSPKDFFPFKVSCGKMTKYVYATTNQNAKKRVAADILIAEVVGIQEIVDTVNKKNEEK